MPSFDVEMAVKNAMNGYLEIMGVKNFHLEGLHIADIVFDPTEALEAEKSRLIGKVKEAIFEKDFKRALSHMNEGIDKKIISCDTCESDWYKYINSFVDDSRYFFITSQDHALHEFFVKDFIRRVEKGEVYTEIPIDQLL